MFHSGMWTMFFSGWTPMDLVTTKRNSVVNCFNGFLCFQRLRCFIHRLISPMHRTDVCIDASNFQPMNGIKQHLGESIIRRDICFNMSGVSFC